MTTALRVLMIEDSPVEAEHLLGEVQRSGFSLTHKRVSNPRALKSAIARENWDLVIADLAESRVSTLIALEKLRKSGLDLPCVLLCRKANETEALKAILAGMPGCRTCRVPAQLGAAVRAELRALDSRRKHRRAEDRLRGQEGLYRQAFTTMLEGCALHELILDASGRPVDYRFLEVNSAFERITGLAAGEVVGKTAREVMPQIEPFWIETYGRVALSGEPARFEHFSRVLGKQFDVVATCSGGMRFTVLFRDISESRNSEIMLKSMIEQNVAGIYNIQDERIAYANPRFAAMFGYTLDEVLALPSIEVLVAEQDRAAVMDRVRRRVSGEIDAQQFAFSGRRKDGSAVEVEAYGGRTEYRGRPAITGTMIDITERKRAEAELQRFRLAMDASPDSYYLTNPVAMRFVDVNSTGCRRLGYTREQLLTMGPQDLPGADRERLSREYAQVIAGVEQGLNNEKAYVYIRRDATRGWTELHRRALRTGEGWLIVTIGRDITDRRLAEQALRENEEKYRLIFEGESDAIGLVDAESDRILDANAATVALYGYSKSELLGMNASDLSANPVATLAEAERTLSAGGFKNRPAQHCRADGSIVPVEISASSIVFGGKRVMCVIVRDITARVRDAQRIANLTRLYATLSATNVTIVHATDRDALFRDLCRVAVETGKFSLAWVGLVDTAGLEIRPVTHFGADDGYLASRPLRVDGSVRGPAYAAMVDRKVAVSNDFINDPLTKPFHAEAAKRGFRSHASLPLCQNGKVIGVFQLYAAELDAFTAEEVNLLEEMASDISFALDSIHREQLRVRAEHQLRKLSSAVEQSGSVITITNAAGTIEYVNKAFTRVTGYTAAEAIGQNPRMLKSAETSGATHADLWKSIAAGKEWRGEFHNRKKDGSLYWSLVTINPLRDDAGAVTHFVAVAEDVTERKETASTIERLAFFDSLTDLPNRRLFRDRLEQLVVSSGRSNRHLGVMFLDLDRFKNINDSLGHDAGDQLLVEVARRLISSTRKGDTVARLGGDEFAVLLPELLAPEDAALVARKIIDSFAAPIDIDGHSIYVTTSIGISLSPDDSPNADGLTRNADVAMYQAKKRGNSFRFYTQELDSAALDRLVLEADIRLALKEGHFVAHYQPQIDLATGRVIGLEALARWAKPGEGLVSPAKFIPLAEQTGLIVPLGEAILLAACAQARQWQTPGEPPLVVAVNISARQFREPGVVAMVERVLALTGLPPVCLELEMTESIIMKNVEQTIGTLHDLKQLGVQISIDDFGTGYSSLSYLKRFPIDKLKIDQSFVRDVEANPDDRAIVDAIISLAHSLRLKVIAEGVETEDQRRFLLEHGCEEAQGYYFARPMPGDEATRFVRERAAQPGQ